MYKNSLTTNQLAKILNVSQSLILKWLKEGKLKAIPLPSKRNKIPVNFVNDFLKEYNMPVPPELQKLIDQEEEQKVNIVVIDDELAIINLIKNAFKYSMKENEYNVFEFQSGIEAIMEMDKIKPDLVLLDLEMPEIDGFEVCKKLNDKYPDLKIVIVSIHANEENEKLKSVQYTDLIQKPFRVKEFVERIDKVLNGE